MRSNSKLKVIFMGGNLLGCTCLRYLVRAKNIKVLLVVGCYQDNGAVVEPKVWNASIARVALNKNLPFIQPKSTKNLQFINEIQKLDRPDLIITVEYDKILDPLILSIPRLGGINMHFSPLPRHRGYFPVMWSLMQDQRAGISLHWINEQVHGGDLIAQQTIPIGANDTSYSLYLKLSKIGMELFKNHFPKIMRGTASRQPQSEAEATYHAAGYPEQRMINWNQPSAMIDRFIRALTFPGFEAARTFYNDMEIKILHPAEMVAVSPRELCQPPGTILNIMPEGIVVKTGDAALIIKKIRINQSMPIDAYKLGKLFSLKAGDAFRSFERLNTESQLNLIVP
ncbi:MAG: methionyl-tRNA formyltransferase [candidate division KSB1 bacterium]|nr:methionyl-tRNA formyltransferase [candidate division KSB1 bacterium]